MYTTTVSNVFFVLFLGGGGGGGGVGFPPLVFISLECKYNKLQFGIRISSIEVTKQIYAFLRRSMSTTKLIAKKFFMERLLPQE